jgi:hypothetical protein
MIEPASRLDVLKLSRRRSLAPFGREVVERVKSGAHLNTRCFTGSSAWDRAKQRRAMWGPGEALLLPPGQPPRELRWPCLPGGLLVDARELDEAQALDLAHCIGSDGTPLVVAILADYSAITVRHADWQPLALRGNGT